MNRLTIFLTLLLLAIYAPGQAGNEFCGVRNTTFNAGESMTFKVYYNMGRVWVGAGEAVFTTKLEKLSGKDVYHVTGDGKTYSSYDWFFKVRDRYETFIDTATLLPLKFVRNVDEGGFRIYNNVVFNRGQNTAVSTNGVFKVPDCIQDVLSAIYYARNIDFDKYKPGDKIPFSIFLDDEVFQLYVRYLGKERIKTKYGEFNAIKFKPLLIKGTIFEGGEKMEVWVSDDANRVPVRVNSPIQVGSIKVDLIGYSGLRYPFTALLRKL